MLIVAADASNNDECGGTTKNCDEAKGLVCDKEWDSCTLGVCVCKSGTIWDADKCKTGMYVVKPHPMT